MGADVSEALFDARGNWRVDPRMTQQRPESSLVREDFWQAFRQCLGWLSKRQVDAFTLCEMEGMKSEEIRKEPGITASNLWVLLHRSEAATDAMHEDAAGKMGGGLTDAALPQDIENRVRLDGPSAPFAAALASLDAPGNVPHVRWLRSLIATAPPRGPGGCGSPCGDRGQRATKPLGRGPSPHQGCLARRVIPNEVISPR